MVGNAMIFFVSSAAVYMGEAKSISCWSTRRNNRIGNWSIVKFDGNTHAFSVIIYLVYFSKLLQFFKRFKSAVRFVFQLGLTLPVCVIDVCVHSVAPLWKNNSDQSYTCPRDYRLPAIMCAQLRTPPEILRTSQHYRIKRDLNWSPMMPDEM